MNSVTDIAVKCKNVKVPYQMKKAMVRPVLMGLRDVLLEKGEVRIVGLGRFFIHKRMVSKAIGGKEQVSSVIIRFRPTRKLALEAVQRWNAPLEVRLSPQEDASSAAGEGSSVSSVPEEGAAGASSSTSLTDW